MTKVLLASFVLLAVCWVANDALADQPNILVILADDMGYGDLSCFGSRQINTPNIDSLAEAGVRCTNAYVTSSVCAPSRAGLMTGRYPNRFGFEHNIVGASEYYNYETTGLPNDEITIANRLKEAGYRTGCIGKWHLGVHLEHFHPNARGFDYYFGRFKGHGYFPKVEDRQIYRQDKPVDRIEIPYTTDWYTKEAIDFIGDGGSDEPWFLYLAHDTPHTPLQAKPKDLQRFAHIENKRRRTICAMQHCLDENVGKLISHLKTTRQFESTLIVFLSDNGGVTNGANHSINAPLNGQKSTFWEGGIRVPMIYCWPNKIEAGGKYDPMVSTLDFTPTFMAAAGKTLPKEARKTQKRIDGVDLLPHLTGKSKSPPHTELYWRISHRGAAVRHGDWKLVRTPHRPVMLYDLSNDVSEQNNLAAEQPELANDLMKKLAKWEESFKDTPRWFSNNRWKKTNRKHYESEYVLEQPH